MIQKNPLVQLQHWLDEERQQGAPDPQQAVLCSVSNQNTPHARIVAIREINEQKLLFFTQKITRKVREIQENPAVSLVFWFELHQREVIIEGIATPLSDVENQAYWNAYPRLAQIRFHSYAGTSMQAIADKMQIEEKRRVIAAQYSGEKPLPYNPYYCGYEIHPQRVVLYAYRTDELSDVWEYQRQEENWILQRLSP